MKKIALFVHHPICSIDCCEGMIEALSSDYSISLFKINQITPEQLDGFDVIAFPGGIGDADEYYQIFKRKTANIVADFVERGGHYLGICMGAYWADPQYFDIIGDVRAVQYIKRPNTDIKRSYGTTAPIEWNGKQCDMYFYDGPTFVGEGFEIAAHYANKDPMAIIKGRVGLIGCHPESTEEWYNKPYIKPRWHQKAHHALLADFVDKLTSI